MATISEGLPVRDRLLLAGSSLMEEGSPGSEVSTRSICDMAGVQAPTLYHHFGSKQALLDEVVSHGFRRFLQKGWAGREDSSDPLELIKAGWDVHVEFGVRHPAFYSHIYGRVRPGRRCGVVSEVESMILTTLQPAARRGQLRLPPEEAAAEILAASSGVVLTLITGEPAELDWSLSVRVRDAILGSISLPQANSETGVMTTDEHGLLVSHAVGLAAALEHNPIPFGAAEAALFKDWLQRIAQPAG